MIFNEDFQTNNEAYFYKSAHSKIFFEIKDFVFLEKF